MTTEINRKVRNGGAKNTIAVAAAGRGLKFNVQGLML